MHKREMIATRGIISKASRLKLVVLNTGCRKGR